MTTRYDKTYWRCEADRLATENRDLRDEGVAYRQQIRDLHRALRDLLDYTTQLELLAYDADEVKRRKAESVKRAEGLLR